MGHFGETAAPGGLRVPDPTLILAITLAILLLLSAAAFALPLALVRGEGRPSVASLGFFAAIGLGFLVLEVVLIQRFVLFLGFPTYALSVVLFALLIFTGIGSLVSARAGRADPRRTLIAALGAGAVMIALAAFGLQPLLRALIDLPFAARIACTIALLAPLGVALGMAMPLGLRRLEGLYPSGVAWAWGINGVASVLALRARDHRRDHARVHRDHAPRTGLLPRGARARAAGPLARRRAGLAAAHAVARAGGGELMLARVVLVVLAVVALAWLAVSLRGYDLLRARRAARLRSRRRAGPGRGGGTPARGLALPEPGHAAAAHARARCSWRAGRAASPRRAWR